jgi:hypothetical protein
MSQALSASSCIAESSEAPAATDDQLPHVVAGETSKAANTAGTAEIIAVSEAHNSRSPAFEWNRFRNAPDVKLDDQTS